MNIHILKIRPGRPHIQQTWNIWCIMNQSVLHHQSVMHVCNAHAFPIHALLLLLKKCLPGILPAFQ